MTSAFELIVWMLRRYSTLLVPQVMPEAASETAPLVSAEALPNS